MSIQNIEKINIEENLENEKESEIINKYGFLNKQDPYTKSGSISRILVIWAIKIVKLSNYISLKSEYLGNLPEEFQSKYYINDLKEKWYNQNYKNKKYYPLISSAISCNKLLFFYVMLTVFLRSIMEPIRLSLYREFMSRFSKNNNKKDIFYSFFTQKQIAFLFVFFRIIAILVWRKSLEYECLLGNKISSQFQCLIYEKLLKISLASTKQRIDTGQVINYIQSDSQQLINLLSLFPDLFCIPIKIIIYSYMLFQILGYIYFFGIIILIIFISGNLYFQKKLKNIIENNLKLKDERMKITTETFNNISILKLYSWENEFKRKIILSRENELKSLNSKFQLNNINNTIQWAGPVITSIICIGLYVFYKGNFRIEDILISLTLFNRLQQPIRIFPEVINNFYNTLISMERIENYLKQDEINENNIIKNDKESIDNNIIIKIKEGNFSWGIPSNNENKTKIKKENKNKFKNVKIEDSNNIELKILKSENNKTKYSKISNIDLNDDTLIQEENSLTPILKNINFEIYKGEFICIIGDVGSGKSTLIHSILNNLIPLNKNNKIIINGSISYTSQIPWLSNSTIKNNILFYNSFNNEKYNKIIDLSCLRKDLEILEGGDLTEIGEKGVNLSGGQKARIAIARALYSDKDIYLFDDPISSLDSNIGMKIIKNCIIDYLKDKTRILVTHSLQYISYADRIFYMNKGEIKWIGTYDEIKQKDFFIEFYDKNQDMQKNNNVDLKNEYNEEKEKKESLNKGIIKRITKDENIEKNNIKFSLIKSFINNMGGINIPITIILFLIIMSIFKISSDIFLGFWEFNQSKGKNLKYFLIYSFLSLGSCLFNYCLLKINSKASITESRIVHSLMIESLIDAPIPSFHDIIPKGQIFNRLSKDLENIDNNSIREMNSMLTSIINFISSLIICSYYEPYCLIFCPILVIIGYFWTKYTIKCMRELYRIEGNVRSPILNITNETIPGTTIIRIFKNENNYLNDFYKNIDENLKVKLILNGVRNLYDIFLDSLTTSLIIFLVIFCLVYQNSFSPSQIGLIITYYEIIHGSLFWGLQTLQSFQNSMIDLERCMFLTKCPKEKSNINYNKNLDLWPFEGKIKFENFSVKYRDDSELVLKNLNFEINPNEKIGIIGRTGSGKSTIALCLFRILESTSGRILIDDIDISEIQLNKLRKNLTIIPQNPSLMIGTLRYNIDPLNLNTDEDIINVMKKIKFDYIINRETEGLLQEISEGGNNLSVGEKQLICITRAILRKSKIIIMDEATANIDYKTEEIIQNVINEILTQSTIITIAHRIKTILNYDKIIVLENGEIVDFDSPKKLMEKKEGIFYQLYQKSNL